MLATADTPVIEPDIAEPASAALPAVAATFSAVISSSAKLAALTTLEPRPNPFDNSPGPNADAVKPSMSAPVVDHQLKLEAFLSIPPSSTEGGIYTLKKFSDTASLVLSKAFNILLSNICSNAIDGLPVAVSTGMAVPIP